MRNLDPRQHQEARVVSDVADVAPPRFGAPSYITIATAQMTWRRTPRQTGDGPVLRVNQILQMFAYGLLIAQIVMVFDEAVEQRLFRRSSHLLQTEGPKLIQ